MSDFLLELFSEEIPARMQAQAAKDLERLVVGALSDRGLLFEGVRAFAGPRRLTLAIAGLPAKQPDVREEKKGPRITAPAKAIDGFLRAAGVKLEDCEKRDDGKGEFYVAIIDLKGRATADVIGEFLPEVLAKLPWPKSMRWPQKTNAPVRWVRPLHAILCTLDGEVVSFAFAGVTSGSKTRGHRFLSQGEIEVRRFEDYEKKLRDAHVILDAEERKAIIFEGLMSATFIHHLEWIVDDPLLDEVAGLVEWPVVLIGAIEDQFMDVPPEILQTAMRAHQKYFSLRDPKTGEFANRFVLVANMVAEDGGKQIVAGNERVLRARLSDAKFFWDQDRKRSLLSRVDALEGVVFHAKLGSQLARAVRIVALARKIAKTCGLNADTATKAALLCKADLTTGVVGEFPELQGIMGGYYARADGLDDAVVEAIREHYRPLGPSDSVATSDAGVCVSLADKLNTITSLFCADEIPTGSSDPFALRRAALGSIRTILQNNLRIGLDDLIRAIAILLTIERAIRDDEALKQKLESFAGIASSSGQIDFDKIEKELQDQKTDEAISDIRRKIGPLVSSVLQFVVDRLKVALREKGTRHDLIDAVFSLGNEDDLVRLVARVEALQAFLKTDDGANLLAGYKRAANILKAEEKKDGPFGTIPAIYPGMPAEERALANALETAQAQIRALVPAEKFEAAMKAMAALRPHVDAFFDKVRVNDPDAAIRRARLELLSRLRETLHTVADFSKIEG